MTNELAITPESLGIVAANDKPITNAMPSSSNRQPYLKFISSKASEAKDGRIGVNHFAIIDGDKDNPIDLGTEVEVLIFGRRAKAMDVSGDDTVVTFDSESDTYADIADRAQNGGMGSGCMAGLEVLVWLDEKQRWATYHMTSKTMQYESGNFLAIYQNFLEGVTQLPVGTLFAKKIVSKKFGDYYVGTVRESSASVAPPADVAEVKAAFDSAEGTKQVEAEGDSDERAR